MDLYIRSVSIGWTKGSSFISRMIRRLDRIKWLGRLVPSEVNHVYLKFDFGKDAPVLIYESHTKIGVRPSPYEHLTAAVHRGKVLNAVEHKLILTPEEMNEVWSRAVAAHAVGYDNKLILAYYVWMRVYRRVPEALKPNSGSSDRMTCNEFAAYCLNGVSPHLDHVELKKTLTPEKLFRVYLNAPSSIYMKDVPDGVIIEDAKPMS